MDSLDILFEDNHIIVVLKPQNVPVQEDESKDPDMLNIIKKYIKEKYNKPGEVFLGLVHRLDRPTGGVMVFAKTSKAAARLSEAIREGEFDKTYLTVVVGEPKEKSGRLIHYLMKNTANNNVMIVPQATEGAKRAELLYKVLDNKNGLSLIEVDLITGRSHQIRVQMNSLKTPVYGDVRYGGSDVIGKGSNLALWAASLIFNHPVTKERLVFKVYPPAADVWDLFDINRFLMIK